MSTHLITGGSGFVGCFIARALLERGEKVKVVDIVDFPDKKTEIEFHKIDILDESKMDRVLKGVDYVHHNAALVPLRKAGPRFWEVNVTGTETMLRLSKKNGVRHFSHMGSSAVFGNFTQADCPIVGTPSHLKPIETYGISKSAAEKLVIAEIEKKSDFSCSVIRPKTIVGTERLGIFEVLFDWISDGRTVYTIGNGNNLFQFAHISDIVEVSIECALRQKRGVFNIGTDRFGTVKEGLRNLCEKAKTGAKVRGTPAALVIPTLQVLDKLRLSPLGPWHYFTYHKPFYYDLQYQFSELNWRPRYSNDEMLWESYQWYLQHKSMSMKGGSTHRSKVAQGVLSLLKKVS